jgi:hypothetical protein
MRIQCNLLPLLLLGLVVTASIVEASRKKRHRKKKGKKGQGRGNHTNPSILHDDSAGTGNEVLVRPVPTTLDSSSLLLCPLGSSSVEKSGLLYSSSQIPTTFNLSFLNLSLKTGSVSPLSTLELESSKRNDRKINIDDIHTSSSSSSSLFSASESDVAQDVIDALKEDGFGSIKNDWGKWSARNDLFDHVVTKSVDFIAGFINQVEWVKTRTLAALFVKRLDIVDKVLKKIKYTDVDLMYLPVYRPELAELHGKFFNAIDMIKKPEVQEEAVKRGVFNLFKAKKHASVIHLINALGKREFNGRKLNDVAIRKAFDQGAWRGIKDIVERLHEDPAITSKEYANGLTRSWEKANLDVFRFLLEQADEEDLVEAKKTYLYEDDEKFREAIDEATSALSNGPSRVPRHARPAERKGAKLAMKTFSGIEGLEPLGKKDTLGGIISGYILG